MTCLYKNREFWKVLEPIRALKANRNGHSYIGVAFRELHSENFFCARIVDRTKIYSG